MTTAHLPHADRAVVPEHKVTGYLLSEAHPDGRGKARFFSGYGFSALEWQSLAAALRRHAEDHPVAEIVETAFGVRYVVDASLQAPDGRKPEVRTVWFIEREGASPRLVTAYPVKRR